MGSELRRFEDIGLTVFNFCAVKTAKNLLILNFLFVYAERGEVPVTPGNCVGTMFCAPK